jgi:hypothetical protein
MTDTVTAADLLSFRLCTGQCLLGLEDQCVCRCRGRWHAVLAGAEIPIPPSLTLATALSGGPAGVLLRRRAWAAPQPGRKPVTIEDADREFASMIAAGQVPALYQIRSRMPVGNNRAKALRQHIARQALTT